MNRALPKYRKRRVLMIGGAAAVVLSGAVITGSALAGQSSGANDQSANAPGAAATTVNCPDVAAQLPAVPAAAQAEVNRNLALLNTQIQQANNQLANAAGQGGANNNGQGQGQRQGQGQGQANNGANGQANNHGQGQNNNAQGQGQANNNGNAGANNGQGQGQADNGANAAQNAVLNQLKNQRVATIGSINTALNINQAQQQVDALATCALNNGNGNADNNGANGQGQGQGQNNNGQGQGQQQGQGQGQGQGNNNGNAGANNNGQGQGNNNAGAANTVNCPDVAAQLPAVPAAAQAEVNRNLTLLNTQIQQANNQLANAAGQGGANFAQNAVLNPLKDQRVATINRITDALDINPAQQQVDTLATCALNQ